MIRAGIALTIALATTALTASAHGQSRAGRWTIGSHAIEASTDREGVVSVRIDAQPAQRIARGALRPTQQRLGSGEVLVLRVEGDEGGVALIAGSPTVAPEILFAGPRIHRGEDVGDRSETDVLIEGTAAQPVIFLAERRADVTLCELGMPWINTRAVDPSTMRLAPRPRDPFLGMSATASTLGAVPVEPGARVVGVPVLMAQSRVSAGASANANNALHDGNPSTVWSGSELDFVVARAVPSTIAIERVVLTAPPSGASLPSVISLVIGAQRYQVNVHESLSQPGARVAVPIVPPRGASCVAMVIQRAAPRATSAVAELTLASALDREADPYAALARMLDGEQGDGAAQALSLGGARGVNAIAAALPTLRAAGARRAVRLLSAMRIPASADALVLAFDRPELADLAREALVRMGDAALEALSHRIVTDARAADLLLVLRGDRSARLRAMLPALDADRVVWRGVRGPLLALLRQASEDEQRAWLAALPTTARPRLRALATLIEASSAQAVREEAASAGLAVEATDFYQQFLRLSALGAGAAGARALATVVRDAQDADLRHEAARVLSTMRGEAERSIVTDALRAALQDRVARVRGAALVGLVSEASTRPLVAQALRGDRWPSVRAAAAELLVSDTPALLEALDDLSVLVVRATLTTLERAQGSTIGARLVDFARDPRRNPSLRIESLSTLAARCERAQAPALEQLVLSQIDPALPDGEQAVGHAALAALARIDIVRARALLERMDANAAARTALEAAGRAQCRPTER